MCACYCCVVVFAGTDDTCMYCNRMNDDRLIFFKQVSNRNRLPV